MPLVSIIVLDYKIDLTPCLDSLKAQTFRDFEIIVIDNNIVNLGFARGCNKGIRAAKGKYIALLNNDAVADKDWLKWLVWTAALYSGRENYGMFASKILRPDGKIDSVGCEVYRDGNGMCIGRGEKDDGQFDSGYMIDRAWSDAHRFPSGCAAMYRRSMLDRIGLFDERFFMYNEDTELAFRAHKAGYGCIYVPSAIVTHLGSASSSKYSLKKLYYVERNRMLIMLKHFTWRQILVSPYWTAKRYMRLIYERAR